MTVFLFNECHNVIYCKFEVNNSMGHAYQCICDFHISSFSQDCQIMACLNKLALATAPYGADSPWSRQPQ